MAAASSPLILQRSAHARSAAGSSALGSTSTAPAVAAAGTGGRTTNLAIHPLPILNMSEHHTRFRSQAGHDNVHVYGILLGTQQGREIELHNSFEIVLVDNKANKDSISASAPKVDHDMLKARQDQFKQVFPSFEIMGWYSSGPEPNERDMTIHKQLLAYNETLLFLKLSPSHLDNDPSAASSDSSAVPKRGDDDLPLYAYETVLEVAGPSKKDATSTSASSADAGKQTDEEAESMHVLWAPCGYRIETGEAERIAVDHASKPPESGSGEATSLIANLTTQYNAVKMLSDRVRAVSQYIALVQSGAFPRDHETLRQVRALVSCLPVVGMPELKDEIIEEYNDVLLTSYLSNLTQQVTNLNELVDKFDVTQEPNGANAAGGLFGGGLGGPRRMPRLAPTSLQHGMGGSSTLGGGGNLGGDADGW
ncbi:unnamed protein product [Tilletia controversa]|uniref:COP9 signalosome complex subunit 6 n=3 Tax=Tilletia TaxID=13289 RepID=A0A8X7MIS7_9BASI|nr:hypothetical protein CF336_g8955 [Tilletia laevis]KAE8181919.1 hypothetical protein CF328_g8692 [Tilletia controversa]KAE8239227.1 hypothetical protein A4X03_0g8659 [Tilletia caries]KAE8182518.1 hypothetical protein CF335_g8603 [Tilletia laevis]KAE8237669.1 hypothetical protein A4X06_0g9159 [Tilletia controversa]